MRYEVFSEEIMKSDAYMSQEHMQQVFSEAASTAKEDRISLNDRLDPDFIACSVEENSLTLMFHTEPWMANTGGTMHGGMIATFCDLTMGLLSRYYKRSQSCVTVHLSVEYARSVPPVGDVLVKATMEKAGRNVYFTSAKAFRCTDNSTAALATAEFM